ncbi:hypothetical protein [Microvirga terricola]|uniref:Chromosome partition protein Smc n=1 Tax=Microvirga terricola TaxID=2719797 RepID=A0ABX0V8G7_9HYPH|nr:hypothetical protein [Microvirga terricola]NIX76150.1 hypothetical protein [Microvirga terricola]
MVETVMIFALGFLAAALIALLVIPAINARAERLARRRAEALFPLSISEMTAEKDHLRAEFAVLQRRIERKAEKAFEAKRQSMEELGRQAMRITALDNTLAERDEIIAALRTELDGARQHLAATSQEFERAKAALAASAETPVVDVASVVAPEELADLRTELKLVKADLAKAKRELEQSQQSLEKSKAASNDLDKRLNTVLKEVDVKRIVISDLETRLMTQTSRGDDYERMLKERQNELVDLRRQITELAANLTAEQVRVLALEEHLHDAAPEPDGDLETRRAALRRHITEVANEIMRVEKDAPQAPPATAGE